MYSLIGFWYSFADEYGEYNFEDIDEYEAKYAEIVHGTHRLPNRIVTVCRCPHSDLREDEDEIENKKNDKRAHYLSYYCFTNLKLSPSFLCCHTK